MYGPIIGRSKLESSDRPDSPTDRRKSYCTRQSPNVTHRTEKLERANFR
jgi:hypothetical protein